MLEKILRSPFMMMSILIMLGVVFVGVSEGWPIQTYYLPFIGLLVIYYSLLFYHNKQHPERKIKVFTLTPYELKEDDEGLQYITFRAMRKVYIFYSFAIPIGILLVFIFQWFISYITIWILVALGVFQYFIYWWEIRKAFTEEEDR